VLQRVEDRVLRQGRTENSEEERNRARQFVPSLSKWTHSVGQEQTETIETLA
jgi:hypothetical protein